MVGKKYTLVESKTCNSCQWYIKERQWGWDTEWRTKWKEKKRSRVSPSLCPMESPQTLASGFFFFLILTLKCSLGDSEFSSDLTTYSREDVCSHGSKMLSVVPFYENWIYEKHFFFHLSKYQTPLASFLHCEKLSKLMFIKFHIILFWFRRKWPSILLQKGYQTFNDK